LSHAGVERGRQWEQAQAFLTSALDDAEIYLAEAPPDMRHRKSILYWYMILMFAKKGPELSTDLRELKRYNDLLKITDELFRELGIAVPTTQLHIAHERISSRYAAAAHKWSEVVARLDSGSIDGYILTRDRAEDRFALWLNNVHEDDEDTTDNQGPKRDPTVLYRCSWCGNPSAVLRKCGGCAKARYCDANCQKLSWPEHKTECKPRKTASSSA